MEKCKVSDEDISVIYEGECENGLADGIGKAEGRDTYKGEFKAGQKDGKGVFIWTDSDRYEGDFVDDKLTGEIGDKSQEGRGDI